MILMKSEKLLRDDEEEDEDDENEDNDEEENDGEGGDKTLEDEFQDDLVSNYYIKKPFTHVKIEPL